LKDGAPRLFRIPWPEVERIGLQGLLWLYFSFNRQAALNEMFNPLPLLVTPDGGIAYKYPVTIAG
jgi:hypothetical protein